MKRYENHSLLAHNTFGMDVHAALFIEYDTTEELKGFLQSDDFARHKRFIHIGSGSNLLFEGDYDGVVMHSAIRSLEVTAETDTHIWVRVGSGYVWDDFVAYCVAQGWAGVENLSAIPGEVGASAVQNIGAYGVEVRDVIDRVEAMALDGTTRIFANEECRYGYRDSIFKRELRGKYIISHVVYRLDKVPTYRLGYGDLRARVEAGGEPTLKAVRDAVTAIRDSKLPDPKVLGNAGSFFTNPVIPHTHYEALKAQYPDMPSYPINEELVKVPAGWLIDHAGWKGKALGRAAVHDRQALVLVNLGGATGQEVMTLAERICEDIYNKYGIHITPEVNYITGDSRHKRCSMRLTFLGTGTSKGVPEIGCTCPVCLSTDERDKRLRVSALVETDDTRILIDCGPDFRTQMLRVPFRRIDGVLLTHEHYDHTGGIDDLRPFCCFGDIDVFADHLTSTHLRERLPYFFREVLYPGVPVLRFHTIAPYVPFAIKEIEVTPLQVMHGKLPILGFRIGRLGFVTDMTEAPEETLRHLMGVDTLVISALRHRKHATHQTISEAAKIARRIGAKETYLIHMNHEAGLHAETDAQLPEHIHLAYDGLTIEVE